MNKANINYQDGPHHEGQQNNTSAASGNNTITPIVSSFCLAIKTSDCFRYSSTNFFEGSASKSSS